jgi:succinoglycan biosynthesis transport protein ExoP
MVTDTGLKHIKKQEQLIIASPQSVVDIRQVSTVLHRRRRIILSVSCLIMSVAGLLALMTKPTYQSYMQILVSTHSHAGLPSKNAPKNADSLSGDSNVDAIEYNAQMKLMLSSMLIQKAVDLLRYNYPAITVEEIKGKKDKQKSLIVTKVEESKKNQPIHSQVLEVSYKANDPVKAQKVLQALEQVYEEYNTKQQQQRLVQGLSFFNERLPKAKNEVIQAEKNLEQFRKKNNLLDPEAQGKILLESLADTQKQLRITRAQIQDTKARYNYLQKELASSTHNALVASRLNQSSHYQILLDEIHKTDQALTNERQRYTDDSPVIQTLVQQRRTQIMLLRQEVKQALGATSLQDTQENKATPVAFTKSEFPKSVQPAVGESSKLQTSSNTKVATDTTAVDNQIKQLFSVTGEAGIVQQQMLEAYQKLKQELINVQKTALGLSANEKSLVESEQNIRSELAKYQNLIAEYKRLLPEVEISHKTLEELIAAQRSTGLKIAEEGFNWQVLEEPQRGISLGTKRLWFLFGGILIGPILGVVIALLREWSSDTIYSPQTLQRLTNLRLLGIVPKLPQRSQKKKLFNLSLGGKKQTQTNQLPDATRNNDSLLEYYTVLPSHKSLDITYQNIQISGFPFSCKSLMLTSSLSGEGKSTLAQGLALSGAHMHQRILLIDANLRKPHLHTTLELSNDWGLSLLLIDETNSNIQEYIQPIHPTIDVLTAGPIPEDPVQLLSSKRMKELIELFKQTYDLVLIDAPSILGSVDARLIACMCDGIVLVGQIGQVTQTELTQATEIFSKSNLNVIGIVANASSEAVSL